MWMNRNKKYYEILLSRRDVLLSVLRLSQELLSATKLSAAKYVVVHPIVWCFLWHCWVKTSKMSDEFAIHSTLFQSRRDQRCFGDFPPDLLPERLRQDVTRDVTCDRIGPAD